MVREHIPGVDMYTQAQIIKMQNELSKLRNQLAKYKKLEETYRKIKRYEVGRRKLLAAFGIIILAIGYFISAIAIIRPVTLIPLLNYIPVASNPSIAFEKKLIAASLIGTIFASIGGLLAGYGCVERLRPKEKKSLIEKLGL